MTILHMNIDDIDNDVDDDDSSIFATKTSTNQKKQIPEWARSKFKLFNLSTSNNLFHLCSPAHLRTILHSMLPNVELFDDSLHQSPTNSNKSILI
jgi:hypothetical protein